MSRELESLEGWHVADGLVGPSVVVVLHPGIEGLLGGIDGGEDLPG